MPRNAFVRSSAALIALALIAAAPADSPRNDSDGTAPLQPIPIRGFLSGAHHWRDIPNAGLCIKPIPGQPSYRPDQVREIAANILQFQSDNGGWEKNYDMMVVLTPEQETALAATRPKAVASFDNGSTHAQVDYLARAIAQDERPEWRSACERGLDVILAAQYPNGGFPQSYPGAKGYHAHITFNDGAMIGILAVLVEAARGAEPFRWLDPGRRDQAREAVARGKDCLLKCQIRVDGALTGWCQQHDAKTFEPRPARSFEPASLCPQDTTEIVRFLIRQGPPTPEVTAATDPAVAWLDRVKLYHLRVDKVTLPKDPITGKGKGSDVVVVADPKARPIWARHYEIGSDRPIFVGRDGIKRSNLAEIDPERRTGTAWYGQWPASLLKEYPKWRNPAE